ncbi:conserved hypothetical protein [Nostocoides australiense Ben110]|uniref:Putative Flp pilus-assembly TadG-like N-terminal domain-containing protein n=1 Tax=Nostocoides australiense Ben110 TaxID=1193182 RepID=W6JW67_9MICO|nr:pilus assembly protein TadG-related protein [Tetrasphaera australiensis]CCH72850.1 conserved hypothetical protein [Tetrasphaera australiensis Ben110]
MRRRRPPEEIDAEAGGITILIIGLTCIALLLILGIITVTSAQLARIRLLDAADAAALDAADSIAERVYDTGVGTAVPLDDGQVWAAAAANLASRPMPDRMQAWTIAPGTGSPDGSTAVVRITGTAELPILSSAAEFVGRSITITVESRARADVNLPAAPRRAP